MAFCTGRDCACAMKWALNVDQRNRSDNWQPGDDQTTAEADPVSGGIDDLRDGVATLNEQVDAMIGGGDDAVEALGTTQRLAFQWQRARLAWNPRSVRAYHA